MEMEGQEKRQKTTNENENVGETEGDANPISAALLDKILSNYLITDEIFKYVSHQDLLQCSLVSKPFNAASRDFLQRQGTTLLNLNVFESRPELRKLVKLLERGVLGGNHPFRGILIDFSNLADSIFNENGDDWDTIDYNRKLMQRIFAKIAPLHISLNIKMEDLDFDFGDYSEDEDSYSWEDEVQEYKKRADVFKAYRNYATALPWNEITSLSIVATPEFEFHDIFGPICNRGLKLLNLKSINFASSFFNLKTLFSSCPALTEWESPIDLNQLRVFKDVNKTSVIKYLRIDENNCYNLAKRADVVDTADLRLKKLVFLPNISKFYDTSDNTEVIAKLVRSSVTSLEEIHVDCHALQLMQNHQGFPKLVSVRKLVCKNIRKENPSSIVGLTFQEGRNPGLEHIFPKADLIFSSN